MIGCSTESTWTPKIQIKDVNTKNQRHEFLDVFLQPFSFDQKAKHYVEESSGKENRRRTCGSETEVHMFGVKKTTERKANLFV